VKPKVPMLDLAAGTAALRPQIDAAIARVIESGAFIQGPEVAAFESEMGRYLGVSECVGVNSGTDALVIALRALGIGPGDEVIVPTFSFFATAEAVSVVGARPVFADIDPRTFNLDPASARAQLSPATRAILPVHLYGQAAAVDAITALAREHQLFVLEDVAQALGGFYRSRPLGTLGDVAAFSFFPSKNLGAFGDGGLIATGRAELAKVCRELRQHGGKDKYQNERIGYNSRLDTLQAAILRVKLPALDAAVRGRRAAAARYDELLRGLEQVQTPWQDPAGVHAFHQYTVRLPPEKRDRVRDGLAARGIQTMLYYPTPIHRLPVYREEYAQVALPVAEAAAASVLSLPIWPEISAADQRLVTDALRAELS
jgi:dTDP-4-amino-4,6-dideoxygalactose transaminase